MNLKDLLPSNPGFGPSGHSAVELDSVALPDSHSTGFNNKLRRVCQAVRIHFLTELCPLIDLGNMRIGETKL